MSSSDEDETKKDVSTVSVHARISDFWTDLPRHWFSKAEAIMAPQKWSDEAKFQFVVGKVGKDVIQQVTDILLEPPPTGKYNAIKERLLEVYEESENKKLQKLISGLELGDQKPSQLLRRMKELARDRVKDETLAVMWQNHLPAWVRGVLAVTAIKDLNQLSLMADNVMENARPAEGINAVDSGASTSVIAEINKLGVRIKNIERFQRNKGAQRNRSRSRSTSRSRSRNSSQRKKSDPNWLCFYHFRYKTKAQKCIQPCNWKAAKTANKPEN